jgi:hypothetical protein
VLRAFTAAQLYRDGKIPTMALAAQCCGSGVVYVRSAVVVLQSEDRSIRERVLRGWVSLHAAAALMAKRAAIIAAYRAGAGADRIAAMKTIGPTTVFDNDLVPAM